MIEIIFYGGMLIILIVAFYLVLDKSKPKNIFERNEKWK